MDRQFKGEVESGTGRGAKFIALPIYSRIFESYLGVPPFHGTLNLKLEKDAAKIVNNAFLEGDVFEDLEYEGKEYGGIVIIPVEVSLNGKNMEAVAVRPHLTTHDSDVVELVAAKHLREVLDLDDGDIVKFRLTKYEEE